MLGQFLMIYSLPKRDILGIKMYVHKGHRHIEKNENSIDRHERSFFTLSYFPFKGSTFLYFFPVCLLHVL